MSKNKKALGKGLSALISEKPEATPESEAASAQAAAPAVPATYGNNADGFNIALDKLRPGKFQPRAYFDEEKLKELTESIEANGVLQPIVVRKDGDGTYQIVAGERRWRAARQAGLSTIPAIVKELTDQQASEVALVENIQRQSLTPIEEADGYKRLIQEFSYTQDSLAKGLGKSRSHITNMLRLLTLPEEVKDFINTGALSMGHARALVGLENPELVAREIIKKGLSVRDAEKFAAGRGKAGRAPSATLSRPKIEPITSSQDEDLLALEKALTNCMGLRVTIEDGAEGGKVVLYFNNLTELDKILQKLGQ